MIYLIGGMPGVGKSTLVKMILDRNKISWMPLGIKYFDISEDYNQVLEETYNYLIGENI